MHEISPNSAVQTSDPQLHTDLVADSLQPLAWTQRLPLTSEQAAAIVFAKALPDDFYPTMAERAQGSEDDSGTENFRPILHRDRASHDTVIASAGDRKTYWNLLSYRPTALRRSGKGFTWKKQYARAVHGVFVDFDCGRKPGDDKWEEPGRLLTQQEVWQAVNELVAKQVLPPFQMWADGTRGCYGVLLFDEPHQNVEEAAEMWRDIRGYFYRRAKHLAADELARAITQPLKAPGACGIVRYYSTGVPKTSLTNVLEWFRAHPHETDLAEWATHTSPWTREQSDRLDAAWEHFDKFTTPRKQSQTKRTMSWEQRAAPDKARIDDFRKYVQATGRCGYSRRQFFLDLASAVKSYELARDNDGSRAYAVAEAICIEINGMLDKPLSAAKLLDQVYRADPSVRRSTNAIRMDMGITELMADRLGLKTLIPPSLRIERQIRKRADMAQRAEQRAIERVKRAEAKKLAEFQRKEEKAARANGLRTSKKTSKANDLRDERDRRVEEMLRAGRATSEIESEVGIHRQQIARIRRRLLDAGVDLAVQGRKKRGRKITSHSDAPDLPSLPPQPAPVCKAHLTSIGDSVT